jgi:peroxiredoxin Q/BCP
MLKVGDQAPLDATAVDATGANVSLRQFLDKYVVLYFYPKDDSPGCTAEACAFRDITPDFKLLNAEVIGVSKDDARSHNEFSHKYGLNFTLWCDANATLMNAFEVVSGATTEGAAPAVRRVTYVINPQGTIIEVIYNGDEAHDTLSPAEHARIALNAINTDLKKETESAEELAEEEPEATS